MGCSGSLARKQAARGTNALGTQRSSQYVPPMKRVILGSLIAVYGCAASTNSASFDANDASEDDRTIDDASAADSRHEHAREGGAGTYRDAATSGATDSIDAVPSGEQTSEVDASVSNETQGAGGSTDVENTDVGADDASPPDDTDASGLSRVPFVTFTFNNSVYIVTADGSQEPENLSLRVPRTGGADRWLVPSPSGRAFALSSARADDDAEILVRASADFSSLDPVLAGGAPVYLEGMPAIVDAGDAIIFSASGGTHARDLFVTRELEGTWSPPEELTTNSPQDYNNQPSLTRDQTAVLFNCGQYPDPESGNNSACRVSLDGGRVDVLVSPDALPDNRNSYVNFPREFSEGVVFESAWPQGAESPETIWQLAAENLAPAVQRTFDNSVSPCVLPDDSLVLLWLGRPGSDGSHELTRVRADGTFVVLWEGVDVADIGIGCTSL